MGNIKLMLPLFCGGSFNREGRKMKAVFVREISDGAQTYRLWRAAGKPDLEYPRAENDKYILHAEINGYLLPLGVTDFHLIHHVGFEPAVKMLYGGNEERERHFDSLRESGSDSAVLTELAEEEEAVERYGNDPARQTERIHLLLNERVSAYLKAKENGGQTFSDFSGALVMNDLARCVELSVVYQAKCQAETAANHARIAAEEKVYCEEQNRVAEQAVSAAIQVIRDGGVLKNTKVKFYWSWYESSAYSIVNYLMRLYQVDVPLRTQSWISKRLYSATIRDGRCKGLQYYRSKNGRCSQKFYQCMNDLIRAVTAQAPKQAKVGKI